MFAVEWFGISLRSANPVGMGRPYPPVLASDPAGAGSCHEITPFVAVPSGPENRDIFGTLAFWHGEHRMLPRNADADPLTNSGSGMVADRPGIERIDDRLGRASTDDISLPPLAVAEEETDVGLAQRGTGEAAIVRRETEI
ncbi:hypothetical protein FV222_20255 [Methylobacterium sp. WL103]|uniref:hypothetical protein n=1 Tax=Methylobacterium sp. WL103 TaxID=2603891 RepID=UPI0011CBEE1C|nr:hypothetical protein [Methylobacterium sp. WL103]TXM95695.1 hypothetical protein FV222_20255 [Methylobacterium sp. WL103]